MMYLVTYDAGEQADHQFLEYADLQEARAEASRAAEAGRNNVRMWQLTLTATVESKTVFKAPNGKVE